MKCAKCNTLLSPFLLRQVHKQEELLLFEIECPNPHCRLLNIVSQEFYFLTKKDYMVQSNKTIERTAKLPGDSNVMFVSLDRMGISWIVRRLSRMHYEMFGTHIGYTPEISRVIATRERFPLPLGWYNVYEVDPEVLLRRNYDHVVSIQRPLEIMYRVLAMYYMPTLSYQECRKQYPKYFENIDKYYNIVYGKTYDIEDNRYINIQLGDLNNKTEAAFELLMDFLNFPKKGRPVIFPVNPPERNWQAYSTTLGLDEHIGSKLREMQDSFGDVMGREEKDILTFLENLDKLLQEWEIKKERRIRGRLLEIQNKYKSEYLETDIQKHKKDPRSNYKKALRIPKIVPFESEIQDKRKFRLSPENVRDALELKEKYSILVLGPIGHGYGCHMSEGLTEGFQKLGHKVAFVNQKYLFHKNMVGVQKISTIIKIFLDNKKPDFIFLSEMRIKIINDLEIPLFYFHTGWYLAPNVEKAHIYYFRQSQIKDAYRKKGRIVETMYSYVNPKDFYPESKFITGVCGIGFRNPWKKWFDVVGSLKPFVRLMQKETDHFIQLGYNYFHTPVDDMKYRTILRQMEALNPLTANGGYITRRMLEGMACKTLLIFRLDFVLRNGKRDDSVHRYMLEEMGYFAGVHYIEIQDGRDIERAWNEMTEEMKEEMREKAYKLTLERHTPVNRAEQILKDYESGRWKRVIHSKETKEDAEQREKEKQARIKETQEIEGLILR